MNVIVTEPQLDLFLRRRISPVDLYWIVDDVKRKIIEDEIEGEDVNTLIYDVVRDFIKEEKFSDIDEFGDDESYWGSYLKYERPLVAYVKHKLGLS